MSYRVSLCIFLPLPLQLPYVQTFLSKGSLQSQLTIRSTQGKSVYSNQTVTRASYSEPWSTNVFGKETLATLPMDVHRVGAYTQ